MMRLVLLRLRQCMLLLSNCRADLSCSIHYVLFKNLELKSKAYAHYITHLSSSLSKHCVPEER